MMDDLNSCNRSTGEGKDIKPELDFRHELSDLDLALMIHQEI